MTQEEKDLLYQDLCGRLPYGVKVKTFVKEPYTLKGLSDTEYGGVMGHLLGKFVPDNVSPKTVNYPLDQFKPYLFPMSSMTEEQYDELEVIAKGCDCVLYTSCFPIIFNAKFKTYNLDVIKWFNKNHFDYNGLIPLGLAKDASNLNIY